MNFSFEIKKEINGVLNFKDKELVKCELKGYLISSNTKSEINKKEEKTKIQFTTENEYNINRFSKLLKNLNINHNINIIGKKYIIEIKAKEFESEINSIINKSPESIEHKKALVRGIFMGSGTINNPNKVYHLEMSVNKEEELKEIKEIMGKAGIEIKIFKKHYEYTIYIKQAEDISCFLAFIGANKAVINFEEIRTQREMNAKVNRIVNCKTANLSKTINSSVKEIKSINKLIEKGIFSGLDEGLKEIGKLRLENPDIALIELAKLTNPPIGKSGANYRLKKLIRIADEE